MLREIFGRFAGPKILPRRTWGAQYAAVALLGGALLAGRAGAQEDVRAIVRTLAAPRDQFESSAQYRARLLRGPIDAVHMVTLSAMGSSHTCGAAITYDADSAAVVVRVATHQIDDPRSLTESAVVACDGRSGRAYVGSNAFGVRGVVRVLRDDRFAIAVDSTSVGAWRSDWHVPLDATAARASLSALRVRLSFRPRAAPDGALVTTDSTFDGATISDHLDLTVVTHVLWADSVSVALFDSRTGRVVGRYAVRRGDDPAAARAAAFVDSVRAQMAARLAFANKAPPQVRDPAPTEAPAPVSHDHMRFIANGCRVSASGMECALAVVNTDSTGRRAKKLYVDHADAIAGNASVRADDGKIGKTRRRIHGFTGEVDEIVPPASTMPLTLFFPKSLTAERATLTIHTRNGAFGNSETIRIDGVPIEGAP